MYIRLNHGSGEPLFRQIAEAVKFRIASGELSAGDQLPVIRGLASELGINFRTVIKAYEVLEQDGLVVTQQGRGVYVTTPRTVVPGRERRRVLAEQVRRLLAEASRMGASPDEVMDILRKESELISRTG